VNVRRAGALMQAWAWGMLADCRCRPTSTWLPASSGGRRQQSTLPGARWQTIRSEDVRTWVQVAAAGLDPAPFGAKALRMHGATDIFYDILGAAGDDIIRQRGRWSSDVAQIYQRVSASAHGAISRAIGDSQGVDVQFMLIGWSQDTSTFRRRGCLGRARRGRSPPPPPPRPRPSPSPGRSPPVRGTIPTALRSGAEGEVLAGFSVFTRRPPARGARHQNLPLRSGGGEVSAGYLPSS
jgi:hypothetical protein